jgi:hypothetical protein
MSYLTEAEVRGRAASATQRVQKSAHRILSEATASANETFDVFLSHSSAEPDEVLLGVKSLLEDVGLSVYVDRYSDPQLSPDNVTPETAKTLRYRMRNSSTLLYIYSQHSKKSRWMPWELGFFDGLKGMVGIVPVTRNQEGTFKHEEYLNLYPYVDVAKAADTSEQKLWINESTDTYALLDKWAKGTEKIHKRSS